MTTPTITRFDIKTRPANEAEGTDEFDVVRFFEKRKLIGEIELDDVARYEDEFDHDDFAAWIFEQTRKGHAPTVAEAMDYLGEEPENAEGEGDEDAEEGDGGSIVPEKYRVRYGVEQNCGDAIAKELTAYVTLPRSKKDIDGGLDRAKLRKVAAANGVARFDAWEDRGLNGGLLRMNTANVLRGMERRGERVVIGSRVWEAREVPKKVRARKSAKKEG